LSVSHSGIADTSEKVLGDNGPLVCIWFDGLLSEHRKALHFLEVTWSTRTLQSNLYRLATWERDSDVKASVNIAVASFKVNADYQQKRTCPKR